MSHELEWTWKEAAVDRFKALFWNLPAVTEGYHEKPSGRDLNARPPNYEAGELSARLPRSLSVYGILENINE